MAFGAAILTVSDTRTAADDLSGDKLEQLLTSFGADIIHRSVITDDLDGMKQRLLEIAGEPKISVVFTTGGTGLGPRDNTPEATLAVIDREAPGLAEAMRRETSDRTPLSMLSRAVCGTRGSTLIINLPGSPKGVEECFQVLKPVLGHALRVLAGNTSHGPQ